MHKGTLVLIPFPFTDLSGQKIRPALVLYSQKGGEDCIVTFISSVLEHKLGTFDIRVTSSPQNGLKVPSIIKVSKIATLQKKSIIGELGMLESTFMAEVDKRISKLFQN
jgi:mRNA interferase MazF